GEWEERDQHSSLAHMRQRQVSAVPSSIPCIVRAGPSPHLDSGCTSAAQKRSARCRESSATPAPPDYCQCR
ncbi:hypothetical protein PFISCL1PPCAC_5046, partial [Pristionchus fissidentatus]